MKADLSGLTAIVTGAATGVGTAVARRLAEAGASVMMCDQNDAALGEAAEDLHEHGARISHFSCALDSRLSSANLLAATYDSFGDVHILVNDAMPAEQAPLMEMGEVELTEALTRNVIAHFVLVQAVAKRMLAASAKDQEFAGAIVNLSSAAPEQSLAEGLSYAVSSAALDQLTRSLAAALAPHRVRVNGVKLGAVMTAKLRQMLREDDDFRDDLVKTTPLGRIGDAEEAAEIALFLSSPRSSFVTGQILPVDGGMSVLGPGFVETR